MQINIKKNVANGFEVVAKDIMIEEIMNTYNEDYKTMYIEEIKFNCEVNNDG